MRTAKVLFLTAFGAGLIPFAPGTWGALVGLIFYCLFLAKFGWFFRLLVLAVVFWYGTVLSDESQRIFGKADASQIVVDEVVGMWIALWGLPLGFWEVLIAFLLFRFFDIYKPWVLSKLDGLDSGWGVMLDDVLAGILANVVARLMF